MGVQDVLVALVALAAAALVARRVTGFAARDTSPKCANCAAGAPCAPAPPQPTATAGDGRAATHPLTFIRTTRS